MVTALDQPADRVRAFEAGADDFLTEPVDDVALVKRERNLALLKTLTDEMLMRVDRGTVGFRRRIAQAFRPGCTRRPHYAGRGQ